MHSRPILVVMARWPAIGRCKRRLAASIGSAKASSIQRELIRHTITVANDLSKEGHLEVQLAVDGIAHQAAKRWGARQGAALTVLQGKGDLGIRMKKQILRIQNQPHPRSGSERETILIGSDLPTLCKRDLIEAIEGLTHKDLVLGPSNDGGYWLIGLSQKLVLPISSWIFSGIPWGTKHVLPKTMQQARLRGIPFKLLNHQNDLDLLEDLSPWQA